MGGGTEGEKAMQLKCQGVKRNVHPGPAAGFPGGLLHQARARVAKFTQCTFITEIVYTVHVDYSIHYSVYSLHVHYSDNLLSARSLLR